jgi:hypothetical protein
MPLSEAITPTVAELNEVLAKTHCKNGKLQAKRIRK